MRNRWASLLRFSALVAAGGALSFVVFFSNCGGSSGMRTGMGGNIGTAGTTGSAGTGGSGPGTAGATGTGGAAGKFMCTASSSLACGASALKLASGHVLTFSPQEWTQMTGNYCNAEGVHGSRFPYATPADDAGVTTASSVAEVDPTAENFRLTLTVGPGNYAGGGLAFDRCVDASAFTALRFKAWIASGDLTGCPFVSQIQTFEQRPMNASPPGGCDQTAGSCYSLPSAPLTLTTMPTVFTLPFTAFMTSAAQAMPAAGQVVALQWQITSGAAPDDASPQPSCTAEIRIDDIDFVTP